MLSSWDDYPIHQTSFPVAHPVTNDPGRYDRYWFTAIDIDATTQVGVGLCVYPNRMIIDAAVSVMRNGQQDSVFASGPLHVDRPTKVGPIEIHVVEPMRILRITLDDTEGISADLTFKANTAVLEDGYMLRTSGPTLISERTRTLQFGTFTGCFTHRGDRVEVTPERWLGLRDRSWGTRTTGTVAESSMAARDHSIYFAWALLNFPGEWLVAAVNEMPDGRREARTGAILPKITDSDPTYGPDLHFTRTDEFDFTIDYIPGTRRASRVTLVMGPRGAIDHKIDLDLRTVFQLKGLGYFHPRWRHGTDHGGLVVGTDSWRIDELDPLLTENVHTDHICIATREDGQVGVGLFEHIAIGAHLPSGLPEGLAPRA